MTSMTNISGFPNEILTTSTSKDSYVNPNTTRRVSFSSSLPLQMALYFNVFYYPLWLGIESLFLYLKYDKLSPFYKVIIICILICMSIVELFRIYLGYVGNLLEKMPELTAHWILTLAIQLPQTLFLLFNEATIISLPERIACSILALFLLVELVSGFLSIRKNMKLQMLRFKLQQIQGMPSPHQLEPVYYVNKVFKDS